MSLEVSAADCDWLCSGQEVFPAMLRAIDLAGESVCLEIYTFSAGGLGERFREALVLAQERGAAVRVLLDAFGSYGLPASFWKPLEEAGGQVRWFNPLSVPRLGIRDHRKLLVCDRQTAFIGGFNIAPEYEGDGITCGWCDLGLKVQGVLAAQLADSFDEMFVRAAFRQKPFTLLRKSDAKKVLRAPGEQLLLSGPGRGASPIRRALTRDLADARSVQIMVAYFLPTWRLRRQLAHLARQGARVQLLLAGKSDVPLSQLAARSLYRRFLKARVEIFEYQPQVLHAKLLIIDDVVYAGSANLDPRSLNLNYELMVRFQNSEMAARARQAFEASLEHCQRITLETWSRSCSWWQRIKQRWAYLLLVRVDPYIAHRQWRALPNKRYASKHQPSFH